MPTNNLYKNLPLNKLTFAVLFIIIGIELAEYSLDYIWGDADGSLSTLRLNFLISLTQLSLFLFLAYRYFLYFLAKYPNLQQHPILIWFYFVAWLIINCFGFAYLFVSFFYAVKYIYYFNVVFLPITLSLLALYYWLQKIRNWQVVISFVISFLAISLYIYATWIEPYRLQVHHITLKSQKIHKPITILHISDIQAAKIEDYEKQVFEKIIALKPDLIIHTGDLIQPNNYEEGYDVELQNLQKLFQKLSPQGGIYHVLGDTDRHEKMEIFAQKSGIKYLFNQDTSLFLKDNKLRIVGLSLDKSRFPNKKFIQDITNKANENDVFRLIIGHAPDYMLRLKGVNTDLCLAGHTHGGQIHIPFLGALITLSAMPREKANGFFLQNNIPCNISAGIGAEHAANLPSIRFNCPPEMTLIHLESE